MSGSSKCQTLSAVWSDHVQLGMFDMHDLDVDWDGDHVHVDDGGNHNEFRIGVNLGAGAEFALGRNWAMNVEFRYQLVDDFDQGVINFGAAYRF